MNSNSGAPSLLPLAPTTVIVSGSMVGVGASQVYSGASIPVPKTLVVTPDMLDTVRITSLSLLSMLVVLLTVVTLLYFIIPAKFAITATAVCLIYAGFALWMLVHTWSRFAAKLLLLN